MLRGSFHSLWNAIAYTCLSIFVTVGLAAAVMCPSV
jgi:hypothetical protein